MNGTGQGFACRISKFLFLYPGSGFTSPCPKETGNLPSVRESPTCPLRSDGCLLLCPSAPGDAAALTPGLSLLPTSLESAHCLSIFLCYPCFLFGQKTREENSSTSSQGKNSLMPPERRLNPSVGDFEMRFFHIIRISNRVFPRVWQEAVFLPAGKGYLRESGGSPGDR
jgi:hypothetical protein